MTKNLFSTSSLIVNFHLFSQRILFLAIGICFSLILNAQVSKSLNVTAGSLSERCHSFEREQKRGVVGFAFVTHFDFDAVACSEELLNSVS